MTLCTSSPSAARRVSLRHQGCHLAPLGDDMDRSNRHGITDIGGPREPDRPGDWTMIRTALSLAALLLATPAWAGGGAPAADHAAHAHAAPMAESRFIIMEGGRNFRDVGGYKTV